ncbi:putative Pentatricopeptide repeat domain containing protein [Klebsormidium nitens]|uniref:Putative Pentatricopeptide repeat domain containing protein n=1 Tax=Klebsormidium nitens TaxID=105231 RepID=A0A1Y1HJZ7_KLENI|nr:putative Pentatricopeptide repeat domain containing protein [Klebsormidium nitens]|eukprot:GAQ78233.1 putative Pentatricopeptide repeat domain containing protein [Klebsormidium nitens]
MVTAAASCCKLWPGFHAHNFVLSDEPAYPRMLYKSSLCKLQHLLIVGSGHAGGTKKSSSRVGRVDDSEVLPGRTSGKAARAFSERGDVGVQAPDQEGSLQEWEEIRRRASSGADASVSFSPPVQPAWERATGAQEARARSHQQKKKAGKAAEVNGHRVPAGETQRPRTEQEGEQRPHKPARASMDARTRASRGRVQVAFDTRDSKFFAMAEDPEEQRGAAHPPQRSTITRNRSSLGSNSAGLPGDAASANGAKGGSMEACEMEDAASAALGLEIGRVYDMRRSTSSKARRERRRGRVRNAAASLETLERGGHARDAKIVSDAALGAGIELEDSERGRSRTGPGEQPGRNGSAGQAVHSQRRAPHLQSPEDVVLSRGTDYALKNAPEKEAQRVVGQRAVKQVVAALQGLSRTEGAAEVLQRWRGQLRVIDANQVVKELGREGRWRRGLEVLEWMKGVGGECAPNQITYVSVLSALGRAQQLGEAERLFEEMAGRGLKRNVVVFNTMMSVYVRCGRPREALALFPLMSAASVRPDFYSYATAINACAASPGWLPRGISLFEQMRREGVAPDPVVYNTLLKACTRGGQPGEAVRIFHQMQADGLEPTLVGFNTLLDAHAETGGWQEAYGVLAEMREAGFRLDVISFNTLVKACCRAGQLREGLKVLPQMRAAGLQPNVGTFTLLISACASAGLSEEAAALFAQLKKEGVRPDALVFAAVIDAADSLARVEDHLKALVESEVTQTGPVYTALIRAYSRHGELARVESALVEARRRLSPLDVGLYNAALEAYSRAGRVGDVVRVFDQLERDSCTADEVSYTMLMDALGKSGRLSALVDTLRQMQGVGLAPGLVQLAVLVDAFAKAGDVDRAAQVFDEMSLLGVEPGAAAFNSLLAAYARAGQVARCIKTFRRMRKVGVRPTVETFSVLIDAFGRAERVVEAEAMFQWLLNEGLQPDAAAWTTLLTAYGRAGLPDEAVECFRRMQRGGVAGDVVAYTALMSALQQAGRDADALTVFDEMAAAGVAPDALARNLRVGALCRLKRVAEAERGVEGLLQCGEADVRTVNALVEAYAAEGQVEAARRLLDRMRAAGLAPDVVSYSAVITALGRLRRFDEAAVVFAAMKRDSVTARLTRPAYEALQAIVSRAPPNRDSVSN